MEQLNLEETTLNIRVTPEKQNGDIREEEACLKVSFPEKDKKADIVKILSLLGIIFFAFSIPRDNFFYYRARAFN